MLDIRREPPAERDGVLGAQVNLSGNVIDSEAARSHPLGHRSDRLPARPFWATEYLPYP